MGLSYLLVYTMKGTQTPMQHRLSNAVYKDYTLEILPSENCTLQDVHARERVVGHSMAIFRPQKTKDHSAEEDHSAHAGKHERAVLTELGFVMKLEGRDIKVGHGIDEKGFLDRYHSKVLQLWGVQNELLPPVG